MTHRIHDNVAHRNEGEATIPVDPVEYEKSVYQKGSNLNVSSKFFI